MASNRNPSSEKPSENKKPTVTVSYSYSVNGRHMGSGQSSGQNNIVLLDLGSLFPELGASFRQAARQATAANPIKVSVSTSVQGENVKVIGVNGEVPDNMQVAVEKLDAQAKNRVEVIGSTGAPQPNVTVNKAGLSARSETSGPVSVTDFAVKPSTSELKDAKAASANQSADVDAAAQSLASQLTLGFMDRTAPATAPQAKNSQQGLSDEAPVAGRKTSR